MRTRGDPVQFAVPTGNFGDVLAGFYAKRLGLPMGRLVVATNENDILQRFWKTGIYEKADSSAAAPTDAVPEVEVAAGSSDGKQAQAAGQVKETLSPAMDILVSSNFERLLWYLAYDTQFPSKPLASAAAAPTSVQDIKPVEDAGDAGSAAERVRRAQACVQGWMTELKTEGRVDLSSVLDRAKADFVAERVSDEQVREACGAAAW